MCIHRAYIANYFSADPGRVQHRTPTPPPLFAEGIVRDSCGNGPITQEGPDSTTDRIDAQELSLRLWLGSVPEGYGATDEIRECRSLVRRRIGLLQERTKYDPTIHSVRQDSGITPSDYVAQSMNLRMKVRYYADADVREWHQHIIESLRTLHNDHGIAVEINRIDERHGSITDFPGEVRTSTPEAVYERDLKRNRDLNQSIDPTPSEAFKRYGKLDIAGNVAVVDDEGTVQWASTLPGSADGYGPGADSETAVNFLADIASSPTNRICVGCLHLVDGDENFCPSCGSELR